jgi:hypothetical protein
MRTETEESIQELEENGANPISSDTEVKSVAWTQARWRSSPGYHARLSVTVSLCN